MGRITVENYKYCPMYRYYKPQSVSCEGLVAGQYVKISFDERKTAEKWIKCFCRGDYCKCPYFIS